MNIISIVVIIGIAILILFFSGCQKRDDETKPEPEPTPNPPIAITPERVELVQRNGWHDSRVVRWGNYRYSAIDHTGHREWIENALCTWSQVIGANTSFYLAPEDSDAHGWITFEFDKSIFDWRDANGRLVRAWGLCRILYRNHEIYSANIKILPPGNYSSKGYLEPFYGLFKHELGHAMGFRAHTTGNCVMNCNPGNTFVSQPVSDMLNVLYQLSPGDIFSTIAPTRSLKEEVEDSKGELVVVDPIDDWK